MSDDDETTFQLGNNTFSDCTIVGEDGEERPFTKASLLANMRGLTADELTAAFDRGFAAGFDAIEGSIEVEWSIALDGLLPDEVELRPQQVAAYIRQLQSKLPS